MSASAERGNTRIRDEKARTSLEKLAGKSMDDNECVICGTAI
jgi:hypothetical protein